MGALVGCTRPHRAGNHSTALFPRLVDCERPLQPISLRALRWCVDSALPPLGAAQAKRSHPSAATGQLCFLKLGASLGSTLLAEGASAAQIAPRAAPPPQFLEQLPPRRLLWCFTAIDPAARERELTPIARLHQQHPPLSPRRHRAKPPVSADVIAGSSASSHHPPAEMPQRA